MPIGHKIRPGIREVLERLTRAGHEAYIVGGAVRDLMLGLEPKDYDVATSASPEEVRRTFGRRRSRIIGRRFRLVHVYSREEVYEVSTFRREPTQEERRERMDDDGVMIWRDNAYGTLEQDARRRDFTVNALYYDAVGDRGIIDFVGGMADLEVRCVRALGEPATRIDEDPVRILRALKLVGQFGFSLETQLAAAVEEKSCQIQLASGNRLFEELLKILGSGRGLAILEAFRQNGFLQHFWPRLDAVWSEPVGETTRSLQACRDASISEEGSSGSKALALATVCLPYVASRLANGGNGLALWAHRGGLEAECRGAVQDFFEPFPISRFFTARVSDILLLMPRFANAIKPTRLQRHPEYKYGREIFLLMVKCCGWNAERADEWPEPPERPRRKHR